MLYFLLHLIDTPEFSKMFHSYLIYILSAHQINSLSRCPKIFSLKLFFLFFPLPPSDLPDGICSFLWVVPFSSHWIPQQVCAPLNYLLIHSQVLHNKGSRHLGDPVSVGEFKGVIVIITQIHFFFFSHIYWSLLGFLEHFLSLYWEECSNLLGLTKTCAHQLGDNLGSNRNALWTYSSDRWGGQVGRRFGSRKLERRLYVCLIAFSCPRKLKMVYVSSD